ncbi:MAG: stage II sporulation protein M [Gemmatimonadaceae bacterium]|nr:stage II sporulation protein M [Gemmatimonadaceae bacterium]
MPAPAQLLDPVVEVETPEQVLVSYALAGPAARGTAVLVDFLVIACAYVALIWLSGAVIEFVGLRTKLAGFEWATLLFIVGQFVLQWGYYVFCEATFDGQTPGKRLLGLRVVRLGGGGVDAGTSAARNLVRVLDQQPGFLYAVGLLASLFNRNNQRLGDMVAGTIVVRERAVGAGLRRTRRATPVDAASVAAAPAVPHLADASFALLDTFLTRADGFDEASRMRLASALALKLGIEAPAHDLLPALRALHARELVAPRGPTAVRSDLGGRREEWALVAEGRERWDAFAQRLAQVRRTGLGNLGEDDVTTFVDDYRTVAADLARLRTADRGRGGDAVYALSRLVAAGHNLIYRRPTQTIGRVLQFITHDVPAEVLRSWRPVVLAAVLLFVPAIVTAVAIVRDPSLAEALVSPGLMQRAEEGLRRANTGGEYLEDGQPVGPVLAGLITTNNVQVTYVAFAGGLTAGVLTVFALIGNGVAAVGAGVGYYVSKGIGGQIFGFVAAHGVLELAAICIGGGAGFLLAAAMLIPGDRTRREALVANGARALHLVACATLFLLVAGAIEGNISPADLPNATKYGVAALTAVAMIGYLSLGRSAPASESSRGTATATAGN